MLTKRQLRSAKTKELERLQARISAELESRRQEAEKQAQDKAKSDEQLFYSKQGGYYQWEYVACGHQERCQKCKYGHKHGPYLYRYFYKDGKQRSEYIRLTDVAKHPEAPARPV